MDYFNVSYEVAKRFRANTAILYAYLEENSNVELSYDRIHKDLKWISKYQISNGIKKLENAKLIEKISVKGKANQYRTLPETLDQFSL